MTTIRITQPWGDPREEYVEDDEISVHAEIAEATRCKHCAEPIAEYPGIGWVHDASASTPCKGEEDDPDGGRAAPGTSLPGNWIGFSTDPDEETARVEISVGDPRGCFTMTLRRVRDDDGHERLFLRVPHPEDSTPHAPMREVYPGYYEIG